LSGYKGAGFASVAVADDGSIIAVGKTDATTPTRTARTDALIARYQPDGQLDWATTYDGDAYDALNCVAVADDGDIIAVGFSSSDAGNLRDTGDGEDALIVRLTPDGQLDWAKTFGGSKLDEFHSVAVAATAASSPSGKPGQATATSRRQRGREAR